MIPCEERLKHAERAWKQERQRAERLETEWLQCRQRLRALEEELSDLRKAVEKLKRYKQKAEDLEAFKERVSHPRFWKAEFAETFAYELNELDLLIRNGEEHPRAGEASAEGWAKRLSNLVKALEEGGYQGQKAKEARLLVLALWVWLRWKEVTHLFESGA